MARARNPERLAERERYFDCIATNKSISVDAAVSVRLIRLFSQMPLVGIKFLLSLPLLIKKGDMKLEKYDQEFGSVWKVDLEKLSLISGFGLSNVDGLLRALAPLGENSLECFDKGMDFCNSPNSLIRGIIKLPGQLLVHLSPSVEQLIDTDRSKGGYVRYNPYVVSRLTSRYAALFWLLALEGLPYRRWRKENWVDGKGWATPYFEFDAFVAEMGDPKVKVWANKSEFKSHVLDKGVKAVNKDTDLRLHVELDRTSRWRSFRLLASSNNDFHRSMIAGVGRKRNAGWETGDYGKKLSLWF